MPGGRPTSYKPEYCELLIAHMRRGYSFESFAGKVECCKQTIYDWTNKHPEFLDAKKIGTSLSLLWWETLGRGLAMGKQKGNVAAYIFNKKNRFNWSDKRDVELSGSIEVESVTDLLLDSGLDDDYIDITPETKQLEPRAEKKKIKK